MESKVFKRNNLLLDSRNLKLISVNASERKLIRGRYE
jgi:hypothetical protein